MVNWEPSSKTPLQSPEDANICCILLSIRFAFCHVSKKVPLHSSGRGRERKSTRETDKEEERGRERKREFVCSCVRMCVRERGKEKKKKRERERESERGRETGRVREGEGGRESAGV